MITKTQAAAIAAEVARAAEARAFDWRWDAAHGEVMDPVWARELADDLVAVEVWRLADGTVKARTPRGNYAAYEMLEGAAAEVLPASAWDAAEMDWRGGRRGVAAIAA
jgi:hypothetical protein